MTSELKCPVCNAELAEWEDLYACTNDHCPWVGNAELWQALIQSQKDLEIARKALHKVIEKAKVVVMGAEYIGAGIQKVAKQTLKQIEHKEQK